jgi:UDPglucose 6-dehydrogenase
LLCTDLATAELVKGAANAFLATKISFINAMADLCAVTGGDVATLAHCLGLDPRIGMAFLRAGIGYGGACLPKDVRGLAVFADGHGVQNATTLLRTVDAVNAARCGQVLRLVEATLGGVRGKRIAIWGAAFKAGTDDVRDSPALAVAELLRCRGAQVTVYDPMGSGNALAIRPELSYADSAVAAAAGADAIVVATAWPEFVRFDPAVLSDDAMLSDNAVLSDDAVSRVIVDACQGAILDRWAAAGWRVAAITGTPSARP